MLPWKGTIGLGLLLTLLGVGCASLPFPRSEDLTLIQRERPEVGLEDLLEGRRSLVKNCASCHGLHLPSERTPEEWERIMVKMQVKAKIDDPTKERILTFLEAYARPPQAGSVK